MSHPAASRSPPMAALVLFNKPYGVLTQFSDPGGRPTLKDYIPLGDVYPAGRLDADSEGLVILTSDGRLQQRIADPAHKMPKTYWVQVEGLPTREALDLLEGGLDLGDFHTRPCRARLMAEPGSLWPRVPPIRERKSVPTAWIEIVLQEGKNRQVRRMTAKVGLPALRLIRYSIGPWNLEGLAPGHWRRIRTPGKLAVFAVPPEEGRTGQPKAPRRVIDGGRSDSADHSSIKKRELP